MGIFSCVGKGSIIFVVFLVNLLVEHRVFMESSMRPVKECILYYKAKEKMGDMLGSKLYSFYNMGKEKSSFI